MPMKKKVKQQFAISIFRRIAAIDDNPQLIPAHRLNRTIPYKSYNEWCGKTEKKKNRTLSECIACVFTVQCLLDDGIVKLCALIVQGARHPYAGVW